ncbi:hypothetical protein N7509_005450 [Penicillium cosmopolitanum]|uniref:Sld7 C-terminal domain-containing protein n=1 Tax=Penicillium cosmopolitanum TaxID=1131564 RepID=A0A9X0BA41_9EURO|nr:uncharacterized protein N7509_005450 [Penicillium cosmopolitanum]KAJ5397337.1 hypothetical protein N7509_005450 [Penicillium cosmopolitanum]
MNVWSGSIALDPDQLLEGIRLVDSTSHWQCDVSKDSKLELRSFVNPALIPLHARAGPNLELHSLNPTTSQWLQRKLTGAIWVNEDELDLHQSLQCPVGLLVRVTGSTIKKTGPATSDFLIYGVLSSSTSCARPPTPPHSSPSETNNNTNASTTKPYELRVYAAPLSTTQLKQARAFPSPPQSSSGEHGSAPAEFLPDISSPSPKRKRVATLFESAALHHRRVRQRGGEAVSQMMAPIRPSSSSQNISSLRIKREPDDDQLGLPSLDRIAAARRSRSVSIGANLHRQGSFRGSRATPSASASVNVNADPQKRAPTPNPFLEQGSRRGSQQILPPSALSSFAEGDIDKSVTTAAAVAPSSPPKNPESIIADNKSLITRTILTCMRLYGFHRSNAKSATKPAAGGGGGSDPDPAESSNATPAPEIPRAETPAPGASADDDEFKAMYHATYKAAAFALRKYLKDPAVGSGSSPSVLEKGKAMTCIDELLRLFCEDH